MHPIYPAYPARPTRNERGATIMVVALSMLALLSIMALAVDVGMLMTARAEAQRAADSAALAGAGALIFEPDDDGPARIEAQQFGQMNTVQGDSVQIDPEEDVDVDLANDRVTVRVHRDDVRGGPVATWFARIFGTQLVNVSAMAVAEAAPAGAATCVKPWAVFDKFDDRNDNDEWDAGDVYDPAITGYGSDFRNPGNSGDDGQGFINDFGRPITLKGNWQQGDDCCPGTGPSWYYPWVMPDPNGGPGQSGAAAYRWNIENCNPAIVEVGQEYDVEPGNMQGPTKQGTEALIADDPSATWNTFTNEVAGSAWTPWGGSPRVGIVPTFDPSREFDPGRKPIEFTGFLAVFITGVQGNGNNQTVTGQILYAAGIGGGTPGNSAAKFVRLVR
jgi:hypothetical protein